MKNKYWLILTVVILSLLYGVFVVRDVSIMRTNLILHPNMVYIGIYTKHFINAFVRNVLLYCGLVLLSIILLYKEKD